MNALRFSVCLWALISCPLAVAQRAVPVGKTGSPVAPPGLAQPLGKGPFTYHTGEGQDIRVTVLARLAWPYGLAFLPNGDLLVSQRTGELRRIPKGTTEQRVVSGGPVAVVPKTAGVHGYMSIAVHPAFAQNQTLYIAYTKPLAENRRTTAVARARYVDGHLEDTVDLFVGEALTGGPAAVAMTPDAKLWIATTTTGDGMSSQDPASLAGKVLRLNDDGTVPSDNPFVGKDGYRPEIYTLGHRTALGLAVHPATSQIFMSEMGPNGGDETNLLKAGSNYGWPIVSLGRAYPGPWQAQSNEPTHHGFELPLVYWTPSISVTGLTFYNGDALPKWKGDLFVGGMRYGEMPGTGRLDRVVLNEKLLEMRRESLLVDLHQRVRDVKAGPDGLLYVATDEEQGAILRIEPATTH
jgi:glucose/arabinose dehydrogenase